MRNVAVLGKRIGGLASQNPSFSTIQMEGMPVTVGIVCTTEPDFERDLPEHKHNVLVRIKAVSCNYRDKTLIFATVKAGIVRSFYVLGSEFVGEVVEVGPEVTNLKIGDRVIGDNHYTGLGIGANGVLEGLPTNHASREYQNLHEDKLIKIPSAMPDEVAAAFSIGAQTSYSMLRKLRVQKDANVLVTAAKSNTSLFAIRALQKYQANVYAISTSQSFEKDLQELGVKELIVIDPQVENFANQGRIREITQNVGLFNYVIDPYFDLHIGKVIDIIAPGGKYITCGFGNQYQGIIGQEFHYQGRSLQEILTFTMVKNIQVIGSCLGLRQDLEDALQDFSERRFDAIVDSVFCGNEVGAFITRTYNARDRFGKVVYQYE